MKRCMIMLTSEYPFSVEETFLESEINFHKDSFDKIIILAIDLQKNAEKTRAVPENTDCYNVTPIDKKLGRNIDKAVGALRIIAPSKYYKYDKAIIKSDIKKKIFFEYFCQRAEREYRYCADILKKYDFCEYNEIIIYSYWFFVTSLIGIKLKKNLEKSCKKIKLISRAHRYDLYEEKNSLNYLPLRKYILENVDGVFVCSDDGKKYLAGLFPDYKNKINTSFLGTFDHGIESYDKSDCVNIVSCSHLSDVKRVDRIISSLALVKNAKFHWTHIGVGELLDDVKKLAAEKLPNGSYEFKNRLSNSEVYDLYKNNSFDLFINVSSSEGIPVSIMEAISFGIPVIATDVGGTGEIVENEFNGILIDSDFSDDELAKKIEHFANLNIEKIINFRKNSRKMWENKFNAKKNYSNFNSELINL